MKRNQVLLVALAVLLAVSITTTLTLAQGPVGAGPALAPLAAVGTAFTYQGQLRNSLGAVNATCAFQFRLYDALAAGGLIGSNPQTATTAVTNGLFTVQIDFGSSAFNGEARWLDIQVACPSGGAYTPLTPRQAITPAPYALSLRPEATIRASLPGDALSLNNDVGLGLYSFGGSVGVRGESATGFGVEGTSINRYGVVGHSDHSYGVFGESFNGTGGVFTSDNGHALATSSPSLIQGPNPKQIALLRWYPAISTTLSFGTGMEPWAIAFDGENMWVTNYNADTVSVIRASDGWPVETYRVGRGPNGIAYDGANMWVVNRGDGDGNVQILRAIDGQFLHNVYVGGLAVGIAFDGEKMWVARNDNKTVIVIRASDAIPVMTPTVGGGPTRIAFDGANMWVTNTFSDTVSLIRASDGYHVMTPTTGYWPVGIAFDGANMWVANYGAGTVTKFRASSGAVLGTFPVADRPTAIAFDGANIWIVCEGNSINNGDNGTVLILRAYDNVLIKTITVGRGPVDIAFDGANMWIANSRDDTVSKR